MLVRNTIDIKNMYKLCFTMTRGKHGLLGYWFRFMFHCSCQPLADGASNPSLHEHSKLPVMPNEESSSFMDGESVSQEQDNDGSSQFIFSSLFPKSLQNQRFNRVSHYPHTLTQTG